MNILKYQDYIKEEKINLPNLLNRNDVKYKKECEYLSIDKDSFSHVYQYLQRKGRINVGEFNEGGGESFAKRVFKEDDLYRDFNDGYIDYMNKKLVGKKIKIKNCIKIKKNLFGKEKLHFKKIDAEIFFKKSYVEYKISKIFNISKIYQKGSEKIYIESINNEKYLLYDIMPLEIYNYIQIVKKINRYYTKDDPYGEEDWLSESKENKSKYKIGDTLYFISPYSMLDKYAGKIEICDITQDGSGDDYYYGIIIWNGREIRWISENYLFEDKKTYELKLKERELTENDLINLRKEDDKRIESLRRKKIEQRNKMMHIDPYGEDDWEND